MVGAGDFSRLRKQIFIFLDLQVHEIHFCSIYSSINPIPVGGGGKNAPPLRFFKNIEKLAQAEGLCFPDF